MKVNISELNADWLTREWDEPVEDLNRVLGEEPNSTLRLSRPLQVHVNIAMIGNNIELKGRFKGLISYDCDRCCESSAKTVEEDFHYALVPMPRNEPGEDDELYEEAPELSFYEGEELDLSVYVHEQVMLTLPVKLLCNDACKGICSGCGANRNTETCACSPDVANTKSAGKLINKESNNA